MDYVDQQCKELIKFYTGFVTSLEYPPYNGHKNEIFFSHNFLPVTLTHSKIWIIPCIFGLHNLWKFLINLICHSWTIVLPSTDSQLSSIFWSTFNPLTVWDGKFCKNWTCINSLRWNILPSLFSSKAVQDGIF